MRVGAHPEVGGGLAEDAPSLWGRCRAARGATGVTAWERGCLARRPCCEAGETPALPGPKQPSMSSTYGSSTAMTDVDDSRDYERGALWFPSPPECRAGLRHRGAGALRRDPGLRPPPLTHRKRLTARWSHRGRDWWRASPSPTGPARKPLSQLAKQRLFSTQQPLFQSIQRLLHSEQRLFRKQQAAAAVLAP